jgi:uncharacterized protein YjbI with pentapeptide repeats
MGESGTCTLHLDLGGPVGSGALATGGDGSLTLRVAGAAFALVAHTSDSRASARRSNAALAAIPQEFDEQISHYVDVPEDALPADRVAHLHVTSAHPDPDVRLPSLLLVSFHVPVAHRLRRLERRTAARGEVDVPPELRRFGVRALARADAQDVWRDASALAGARDTAYSLLFHHPQLGSLDPYAATIVMDEHIKSTQHAAVIDEFWKELHAQGQYGWSTVRRATDANGRELSYEFDLADKRAGDPVELYELTERTSRAMAPALEAVLRTVAADERLRERAWTRGAGVAALHQPEAQPGRVVSRNSGVRWTLQNFTPDHGVSAERDTIRMGSDKRFSIDVKNHHMRTVCAYAQFLDDGGVPLGSVVPWDSNLGSDLDGYESAGKKYLKVVPPRASIMGVPINAQKASLAFRFPDDAASVTLLFGGLGTSKWDLDVCLPGTILTGIFNYAIPTLFLVSTAGLEETKWLTDVLSDIAQQAAALLAGAAVMGEDAVPDALDILGVFVEAIGGVLVSKGLEKLAIKLTAKMTAAQLAGAIPFVGWVLKAVNMAAAAVAIGITTEQVLSSPATLRIDVKRTMDLQFTLKPDPLHGEAGNPDSAVWPGVSARYQVTVQYRGGTSFVQHGAMPDATTSDPLVLTFSDIPAGGWLRIIAGIYAENDWLCGRFEGEELRAMPPASGGAMEAGGTIEEILVPLSADTQYEYKQRIVYDAGAGGHVWRAGARPLGTIAQRNCANSGTYVCEIHGVSLNGSAFQLGYSWRAANLRLALCGSANTAPTTQQLHTFQNVSVLDSPESRLRVPSCALAGRTLVAYDQFLDESKPDEISQRNFFLDSRDKGPAKTPPMHLRQLVLKGGAPTIDLDADMLSWGAIPFKIPEALAVHPGGYVIAASWIDNRLAIVELPERAVPDERAPIATLAGGPGKRVGLLDGPRALTVMPDGRIIVLESINRRIQAFDTNGNVVPSFDGDRLATVPAAVAADLDAARFSPALHDALVDNALTTHRCDIPRSFIATLDNAQISAALRDELALEGVRLSLDPEQPDDPAANAVVDVVRAGSSWRIVDEAQGHAHTITAGTASLAVRDDLDDVTIEVRVPGEDWIVTDHTAGVAYHLLRDAGTAAAITVLAYTSVLELHGADERLAFLDVAAEAKGYLYVLSHGAEGRAVEDYNLDIYEPNGRFLTRTVGVNAMRIAVDLWRNLFAVTFDAVAGPGGRTEPTIAQWTPSPPDTLATTLTDFTKTRHFYMKCAFREAQKFVTVGDWIDVMRPPIPGYLVLQRTASSAPPREAIFSLYRDPADESWFFMLDSDGRTIGTAAVQVDHVALKTGAAMKLRFEPSDGAFRLKAFNNASATGGGGVFNLWTLTTRPSGVRPFERVVVTPPWEPGGWRRADLTGVDFRAMGAVLPLVPDWSEADLTGAIFDDLDLRAVNFDDRAKLTGARLHRVNLAGHDFRQANLDGADFTDANLAGANLANASMVATNFAGADLSGARFGTAPKFSTDTTRRTSMVGAKLDGAQLTTWAYLDLQGTTMSVTPAEGVDARHADLRGATITGARLIAATLDNADLQGAVLVSADLTDASLREVTLRGASMTSARLVRADCTKAQIGATKLLFSVPIDSATLRSDSALQDAVRGAFATHELALTRSATLAAAGSRRWLLSDTNQRYRITADEQAEHIDVHAYLSTDHAAVLTAAYMRDAVFDEAELFAVNMSAAHWYGSKASATGANLEQIDASNANLGQIDLSDAQLMGARFNMAILAAATLTGADLGPSTDGETASMHQAHLGGANLTEAKLHSAVMTDAAVAIQASAGATTIVGVPLFTLAVSHANTLDDEELSEALLDAFIQDGYRLASDASATKLSAGSAWEITQGHDDPQQTTNRYASFKIIRRADALHVHGSTLWITRVGDDGSLDTILFPYSETQLTEHEMNAQTTCPNGKKLSTNQSEQRAWHEMMTALNRPPKPPACIPDPEGWGCLPPTSQ